MAFTTDDFNKVWASTSPLTPYDFEESNYKEGWNFIGSTPPARQMWDYLQKLTDEKIQYIYNNMIPCGIVQAFAGSTTPQGWLLCDGSAVSRTQYSRLFGVIGTTYGAGDGTDTFNLPNLIDKFVQGNSVAGTEHSAGLPNITGAFDIGGGESVWVNKYYEGAFNVADTPYTGRLLIAPSESTQTAYPRTFFNASRSSAIYGNSTTVQPPALTMRYIIKY